MKMNFEKSLKSLKKAKKIVPIITIGFASMFAYKDAKAQDVVVNNNPSTEQTVDNKSKMREAIQKLDALKIVNDNGDVLDAKAQFKERLDQFDLLDSKMTTEEFKNLSPEQHKELIEDYYKASGAKRPSDSPSGGEIIKKFSYGGIEGEKKIHETMALQEPTFGQWFDKQIALGYAGQIRKYKDKDILIVVDPNKKEYSKKSDKISTLPSEQLKDDVVASSENFFLYKDKLKDK